MQSKFVESKSSEKMMDMLKEKMTASELATFVGLYEKYGAIMYEDDVASALQISVQTLRVYQTRGTVGFPMKKLGQKLVTPTASFAAHLHQ